MNRLKSYHAQSYTIPLLWVILRMPYMICTMYKRFCRTNTESSEVEIQHIKHKDVYTVKVAEAQDDDINRVMKLYMKQ